MHLLIASILLLVPQDTTLIEPGSPLIDGSIINSFSIRWEQSHHERDGTVKHQRFIEERVEMIEIDNTTYLKRTQVFTNPDGTQYRQFNLVNAASFTPLRWEDENTKGDRTHFDYHGKMISGAYISGILEPSILIHRELDRTPFDQRIAGLLIASLPLKNELVGKFPMAPLRPPRFIEPDISWFVFKVTGKETIETEALGSVEAWKVETSQTFTYWIIGRKPYVARVEFPLRGGKSIFEIDEVIE